jgi:integral membrane protein (TIGR01906 family)
MADVAALNRNAVRFMIFGFVAGAALAAVSYMAIRKAYIMCKCAFFSIIGVLCGFGAIAVWAAADFNSFWINFHHVFFRNDLWVLDPAVSRMIRMFEQSFFFDMVALILALFISIVTASLLATGIAYKKLERRNA